MLVPCQCRGRDLGGVGGAGGEVDQGEAVRVLDLCGAYQAPDGGLCEVPDALTGPDGDGPAGDQHQAGGGGPVLGEPAGEQVPGVAGGVPGRCRRVRRVLAGRAGHDDVPGGLGRREERVQAGGVPRDRHLPGHQVRRPVGRLFGCRLGRQRFPAQREQGATRHGGGIGRAGGADRARLKRLDQPHRMSRGVPQGQDEAFVRGGRRVDPQGGAAARRGQGHSAPAQRLHGPALVARGVDDQTVQGRVEQGGVQVVGLGVRGLRLGQVGLGELFAVASPGGPQPLERRPVLVPPQGEVLVHAGRRHGCRAGGRPLHGGRDRGRWRGRCGGRRGRGRGCVGAEGAGGVLGPLPAGRPARYPAGPQPVAVLARHPDAQVDGAAGREFHERGDGQFLDPRRPGLRARVQCHLQERGGRHDGSPRQGVVGQPGMGAGRQAPGEHGLAVAEIDGRAEQGMAGRGLAEVGQAGRAGRAGRAREPVTAALEGVGGRVDAGGGRSGEPFPRDGQALDVCLCGGGEEPAQVPLAAAQRAGHDPVGSGFLEDPADAAGQHRVRAHFDERGVAGGDERFDGLLKAHGVPQVAVPVGRVESLALLPVGGDRGHQRDLGGARCQRCQSGQDLLADRFDRRAVRGEGGRDRAGVDALGPVGVDQFGDRVRGSGHGGGGRPVDRGDAQRAEPFAYPVRGQRDHGHRPLAHQVDGRCAAHRDGAGAVVEGERPGHDGGGDLALGVADHGVGDDPGRPPQLGQRHHHGPQRGLYDVDPIERERAVQDVGQRPVDVRGERLLAGRQAGGEDGVFGGEGRCHAPPLAALPGEDQDGAAGLARRSSGDEAGGLFGAGQRVQGPVGFLPVTGDHHGALVEGCPGGQGRRRGEGVERRGGQRPGPFPQRGGGPGRQDQGHHGRPRRLFGAFGAFGPGPGPGLGGRLGQDDVRVGAADSERRDAAAPRLAGVRPGTGPVEQGHLPGRPVHVRGRLVGVQCGGQRRVADGLDHFDDAADARRRLCVSDVGFEGAQPQRVVPVVSVGGQQGARLDRVAQRGAGPVRLHGVDLPRRERGVGESVRDDALLGDAARRGQPVGGAVGVDGAAGDDGQHPVAVAAGAGEAFDDEHARALAPAGAVRPGGEGLAAAVGGQHPLAGELHEHAGGGHDRDPSGQGERAFPGPHRPHRLVQCDQ